jgi:hypothetical protein
MDKIEKKVYMNNLISWKQKSHWWLLKYKSLKRKKKKIYKKIPKSDIHKLEA